MKAALTFCERFFARVLIRNRILVVNQPELQSIAKAYLGWNLIVGTNNLGEFSGWQQGLDLLPDENRSDGVIFANDTISTHRYFSVARRRAFLRSLHEAPTNAFVGFRGHAEGKLDIGGLPLPFWASTFCFMLTRETLRRLDSQLYLPSLVESCVRGGSVETTFFANMSDDLDKRLRHWLFDGAWYKSERLSDKNEVKMRFKAKCILAEMWLSARSFEVNAEMIDPFVSHPMLERADRLEKKLRRWSGVRDVENV